MNDNKDIESNSLNHMKNNIMNQDDLQITPFISNGRPVSDNNSESIFELPKIQSYTPELNENYNTFITDKIKYIQSRSIDSNDINEEELDTNAFKPYILNNLCMEIKEKQQYFPKGLNPLFFIINPEKPFDKEKYRTMPRSFKVSSHLNYNSNDNYMKYITDQLDKIEDQKIFQSQHDSLQRKTFVKSFNKNMKDRLTFKTDIKKIIFNNGKDLYEDKVKMIKQLTKIEMMNRASGKGMFLLQNSTREKNKKQWTCKDNQRKHDSKENPLNINLQKKECFSNKKFLNKTGEIFFNRNFLRLTFDSYKQQKEELEIERKQSIQYNHNIQKLYGHEKKSYDYSKMRDNKVKEAIKSYTKIGLKIETELKNKHCSIDNKPSQLNKYDNYDNQSRMSDNDHILIHE